MYVASAAPGDMEQFSPEEIDRRINFVYRHLLEDFDPAAKKLVDAGAALSKALFNLSVAQKAYAEAVERVGQTAKPCHSNTGHTGECLLQVSQVLAQIQEHHEDVINWFGSQFINPINANVAEDPNTLNELWTLYHKGQKAIGKEINRGKKKGAKADELLKERGQLQMEALKQALNEERKRYVFVLERHCAWLGRYYQMQKKVCDLIEEKIDTWRDQSQDAKKATERKPSTAASEALRILDTAIQGSSSGFQNDIEIIPGEEKIESTTVPVEKFVQMEKESPVQSNAIVVEVESHAPPPELQKGARRESTGTSSPSSSSKSSISKSNSSQNSKPSPLAVPPKKISSSSAEIPASNQLTANSTYREPLVTNGAKSQDLNVVPPPPSTVNIARETPSPAASETTAVVYSQVKSQEQQPSDRETYLIALYPFLVQDANQIDLEVGDIVRLIKDGELGWIYGENLRSCQKGWFPKSYVDQPATAAQSQINSDSEQQHTSIRQDLEHRTSPGNAPKKPERPKQTLASVPELTPVVDAVSTRILDDIVLSPDNSELHVVNYDTVPKKNPFADVKLRRVVQNNGTPVKYT